MIVISIVMEYVHKNKCHKHNRSKQLKKHIFHKMIINSNNQLRLNKQIYKK